jgi:hypothetical protein
MGTPRPYGTITFRQVQFGLKDAAPVSFRGIELAKGISFANACFHGPANFENVKFKGSSNFRECTFHVAPNFHDAELHQGTTFSPQADFPRLFKDITSEDATNAYRTLKLAMHGQHALGEELGFFLLEMRSAANNQKPWLRPLYRIYDAFSKYGLSVQRPFWWFLGFNGIIAIIYRCLAGQDWDLRYWDPNIVSLTLYGAVPFAAALRWEEVAGDSDVPLFEPHLLPTVQFVVVAQSIISATLLFLMVLGLRNMFKIK